MRRLRAIRAFGRLLPVATALLASVLLIIASSSSAPAATRLVRVPADAPGLTELGLALDHSTRQAGEVIFAATDADLALLAAAGIPFEIEVDNLESFYSRRIDSERNLWERAATAGGTGFGYGSMGGYYTLAEVVGKLDEMRANYPQLITAKQSIGLSIQGRDLWLVKISDNPEVNENEPSILITALTHAREPEGMEVVIYFMFHLLENYGTDPEVTYLVNERQLYFVPVLNPDGYYYNQSTNPAGGGLWRKNRRDNGGGIFGVDLNRNYSYNWGYNNQGSSGTPSSDTYRGTGPFSEPETSAIRNFHIGHTIINGFHYHTYGNHEIHPFGHVASAFPPEPDRTYFTAYAINITAMNGYDYGNASQTVGYLVNGDAVDYSYGEQVEKNKVFAFTPEVGGAGDGFWPPPSRIFPLAQENLGPNLYWAWITGGRAQFVSLTAGPEVPAGAASPVVVRLQNVGLSAASDISCTLQSADPYVTIADPVEPFPTLPAHALGDNASNPLEFFVSAAAPGGHVIDLTLTVSQGGATRAIQDFQVTVIQSTAVTPGAAPAASLALTARPNPLVVASELAVELPAAGPARIVLYDVSGRRVRTLADGTMTAGEHRIAFDGRDAAGERLPNGVYLARLEAGGAATELRLVVLR